MIDINEKNPYKILGVTPNSSKEDIKAQFSDLMKKYHPDNGNYEEKYANTVTGMIISAYKVVLDYASKRIEKTQKSSNYANETNKNSGNKQKKKNVSEEEFYDIAEKIFKKTFCMNHYKNMNCQISELLRKYKKPIYLLRFLCGVRGPIQNGSFETRIVGVTFDDRQYRIAECYVGQKVFIVREVTNNFDTNAILVVNEKGESLGHLSAELAELISPLVDKGKIEIEKVIVTDLHARTKDGAVILRNPWINIEIFCREGIFKIEGKYAIEQRCV